MADGTVTMSHVVSAACVEAVEPFSIATGNNNVGKPTLKWTVVEGADHYEVYRAETKDGPYTKTFTTKGVTYTNTSARAGNTYYYQVKIVMADGTVTMSHVVSAVCGGEGTQFAIVTGNNMKGQPTLTWNAIPGAERYEIYRSDSADGPFVKAFSTTGRTYTNTSAKPVNTYYYKLKVYMKDGTEEFSHVVSEVCLVPDMSFTITVGNNDAGKPTLKWDPLAGAERYEVYRSDSADGEFILTLSTKGTTYTNTAAKPGNTYYYKVKAYFVDGTEKVSHVVSKLCISST